MPNQPDVNKRKLGCSLFPDEINQLKGLAADRDLTVTELLRKIALGAIGLSGDPEFDALENAPTGPERPKKRPMNAKPPNPQRRSDSGSGLKIRFPLKEWRFESSHR